MWFRRNQLITDYHWKHISLGETPVRRRSRLLLENLRENLGKVEMIVALLTQDDGCRGDIGKDLHQLKCYFANF